MSVHVHMNHLRLPMGTCTAKQRDGLVFPFLATGSFLGRGWYFSFDQVDSWSQVQEGKRWKLKREGLSRTRRLRESLPINR